MAEDEHQALIDKLAAWGRLPDDQIPLAEAALTLSALNRPGLSLDRYRVHLDKLVKEAGFAHRDIVASSAEDNAMSRIEALREVLVGRNSYAGDSENYDDLQNADLISVIDRRKGMPITLSILYIHVAREQGWQVYGLNFPGHFVIRVDHGSERLIADPFRECRVLQANDLRQIIKRTLGPRAELSAQYYEPASNRAILIRLQNNIKIRQIEHEDYEEAIRTVEAMRALDPNEYRLLLDAGVLYARTRRLEAAIKTLESYILQAPDDRDRHEAALLLQQIRQLLG
ncbi:MAG TPA: transglutaminase-like domain-containing protein [Patescibacteria group bacterium]|nr:transglutaminase-like domain-containing protein [Patescibacteria group bacterium]